jgi:class 3 adenylate cyclase
MPKTSHLHSQPPREHLRREEIDLLCARHAPHIADDPTRVRISERVRRAISTQSPLDALVLTADIRRSASVLKESIDVAEYARLLNDFVGEFRTVLSFHGGWYDKFTGDGFICYWLPEGRFVDTMQTVLDFSCSVMESFKTYYYPAFLANMRNIPANIGLSIGIDAGPCYLTPIVGDLTLIGAPIVGSVRMSGNSGPYHLMLNAHPGGLLLESMPEEMGQLSAELGFKLVRHQVKTKEYPEGQITHAVEFFRQGKRLFY